MHPELFLIYCMKITAMNEFIRKTGRLPFPKAFIIVFAILSMVLPGILFMAHFLPELLAYDAIKLVLVSAALTFPVYLSLWLSFILILSGGRLSALTEKTVTGSLFLTGAFLVTEVLISVVLGISFEWQFNAGGAGWLFAFINFILFIIAVRDYRRMRKRAAGV